MKPEGVAVDYVSQKVSHEKVRLVFLRSRFPALPDSFDVAAQH
jgi:hypothetical protein